MTEIYQEWYDFAKFAIFLCRCRIFIVQQCILLCRGECMENLSSNQ